MEFSHKPVMLAECIEALDIKPNGIYLDGTMGGGGHSREIAKRLTAGGRLIAVDRDADAHEAARERLREYIDRVTFIRDDFKNACADLDELGIGGLDGVLLDLGVSSWQLDSAERGFSYMKDAPLDMRMDRSAGESAYRSRQRIYRKRTCPHTARIRRGKTRGAHRGEDSARKGEGSHPHDVAACGAGGGMLSRRDEAQIRKSRKAHLSGDTH